MQTMIQARVPAEDKKMAEKILADMGMSVNEGVRVFLKQIINTGSFPFTPSSVEVPTPRLVRAAKNVRARKDLKKFSSVAELKDWLHK